MLIALNSFVDQSDKLQPKGKIVTEGLTSPCRNPMYDNFNGQIILDWRPSDNFPFPVQYETKRYARLAIGDYDIPIIDNEGFALESPAFWSVVNDDDTGQSLLNFNTNAGGQNFTIVGLCAAKVKNLTHTAGVDDTKLGWRWQSAGGVYRYETRFFYEAGGGTQFATWFNEYSGGISSNNYLGPPAPHLNDWQPSDFQDKWILTQICRLPGAPTKWFVRLLGGPYTTPETPWETAHVPAAGETAPVGEEIERLYIPSGNEEIRLGFVTLAMYTGNNDAGDGGTEVDAITWTIFDAEHTTGEVSVSGNSLIFSCTGEVAFEIYSDSMWKNTDGTTGEINRVWYDTVTRQTVITDDYTKIRVIFKNTGLMNSETRAVLTYLETDNASTLIANAGPDKTISSGGNTTLDGSASGGVGSYTYLWSPTTHLNDPTLAQPIVSELMNQTTYTLTVTDLLGSTSTDTMTVYINYTPGDLKLRTYFISYGNAAEIHIKAYKPFVDLQTNILTLENDAVDIDATKKNSVKSLTNRIKNTFNQIVANYSQIRYLEDSFVELQKYIKKEYGYNTIDECLTDIEFQISPYCAKVFNQLGQTISDSNISN